MLNTSKLLYVLPDMAVVAELLPAKKSHTFSIQSFRQINGQFLNEQEFIAENIDKLINKLEPETYTLILPDFLFTNTILEVKDTSQTKIDDYIKKTLLPQLGITKDSHSILHTPLTQYQGATKLQFSALEKSILELFGAAAAAKHITIAEIVPLSWTLKAAVSLEPSMSLIQFGTQMYVALHYIGLDQCISYPIEDVTAVSETVSTIKGSQPSVQTLYLVTNQHLDQQLKDTLSSTIPLQQLATDRVEEDDLPAHLKFLIETGQRTLSIKDYPVPRFPMIKLSPITKKTTPIEQDSSTASEPATLGATPATHLEGEAMPKQDLPSPTAPKAAVTTEIVEDEVEQETSPKADAVTQESLEVPVINSTIVKPLAAEEEQSDEPEPDITQFAAQPNPQPQSSPTNSIAPEPKPVATRPVIKNRNGAGGMLKMIFVAISVLIVTVAVGVGIGLGFLQLSGQSNNLDSSPIVEVEPTPTPTPTPTATPKPVVDKEAVSILVVNATTRAGYASTVKKALEDDGFSLVTAGNAKGDYEPGNYLLMSDENAELLAAIAQASDLEVEYDDAIKTEDTAGKYDAVLVLND